MFARMSSSQGLMRASAPAPMSREAGCGQWHSRDRHESHRTHSATGSTLPFRGSGRSGCSVLLPSEGLLRSVVATSHRNRERRPGVFQLENFRRLARCEKYNLMRAPAEGARGISGRAAHCLPVRQWRQRQRPLPRVKFCSATPCSGSAGERLGFHSQQQETACSHGPNDGRPARATDGGKGLAVLQDNSRSHRAAGSLPAKQQSLLWVERSPTRPFPCDNAAMRRERCVRARSSRPSYVMHNTFFTHLLPVRLRLGYP